MIQPMGDFLPPSALRKTQDGRALIPTAVIPGPKPLTPAAGEGPTVISGEAVRGRHRTPRGRAASRRVAGTGMLLGTGALAGLYLLLTSGHHPATAALKPHSPTLAAPDHFPAEAAPPTMTAGPPSKAPTAAVLTAKSTAPAPTTPRQTHSPVTTGGQSSRDAALAQEFTDWEKALAAASAGQRGYGPGASGWHRGRGNPWRGPQGGPGGPGYGEDQGYQNQR
jgi:hypothetical protein